MKFSLGQKVVFLHEVGGGFVTQIDDKNRYVVEDENGFTKAYLPSEIAPIHNEDYKLGDDNFALVQGETTKTKINHVIRREKTKTEAYSKDYWEIDLHIEEITDSHKGLTNAEIINKQMNAFKIFYHKAQYKRIRKIVVIHGVGMGVLKYEVRRFLDQQDDIHVYDAYYGEYGKGATTIEFFY